MTRTNLIKSRIEVTELLPFVLAAIGSVGMIAHGLYVWVPYVVTAVSAALD